jgi:hypothetical protein
MRISMNSPEVSNVEIYNKKQNFLKKSFPFESIFCKTFTSYRTGTYTRTLG